MTLQIGIRDIIVSFDMALNKQKYYLIFLFLVISGLFSSSTHISVNHESLTTTCRICLCYLQSSSAVLLKTLSLTIKSNRNHIDSASFESYKSKRREICHKVRKSYDLYVSRKKA